MDKTYPDEPLIRNLREQMPRLKELLAEADKHFGFENHFYRYYHFSYKVYPGQDLTLEIVEALKSLMPDKPLNPYFTEIIEQGTGKEWKPEHNDRWTQETRPILEAEFHAIYFLRLAVKYGRRYKRPPKVSLKNGYAALMELYGIR